MTNYSPELVNRIIHRVRQGRSVGKICLELAIGESTFYNWLKDPEKNDFQEQYATAKEDSADFHADEMIDIADTEPDVARARVRIDTRKWIASKLKAKKYGDSTQVKHADADGNKLSFSDILKTINGSTADLPRTDEMPE